LQLTVSVTVLNETYAAEQLNGSNRRIVVAEPVAARDERRLLADTGAGHHPMGEEASPS
jgi:hypothetical protein